MNNKTFGVVVGIIVVLAFAMFAGLYALGLSGNKGGDFDEGYEYHTDYPSYGGTNDTDPNYMYIDGAYDPENYDYYYDGSDIMYNDAAFYFDEGSNTYNFDDYQFESFDVQ